MSYYRKPKPETLVKNREINNTLYADEIKWLNDHAEHFKGNHFLVDMHHVLLSGRRKMTSKMVEAVRKAMKSSQYDPIKRIERREKIKPIMEKVDLLYNMVYKLDSHKSSYFLTNFSALPFIESLKEQLKTRMTLTEKQMRAMNKVFKRYNKQLENKLKKNEKKA
jgi:hypothetical protein